MRGHAETRDLQHLEIDIGVDHVVGKHTALGQEGAILVQLIQRHVQRIADLGDTLLLFRLQIVEILIHRFTRVDLVLDPVQARHHHGGKGKVRVAGRVRETHLDAAPLRAGNPGDADGGGTVAGRVGQHDRRFESGD